MANVVRGEAFSELGLQSSEAAVHGTYLRRVAVDVSEDLARRVLFHQACNDRLSFLRKIDHAPAALALRFFWWNLDAVLLQPEVPCLNVPDLLRTGATFPGESE